MKPHLSKVPAIVTGILILASAFGFYQLTKSTAISFTVLESGFSLIAPEGLPRQEAEPSLIVIASPEDMQLPAKLELPESLAAELSGIDLENSVVILVQRGRQDESGTVQKVVRRGDRVVIQTNDLDIGPGNYVLADWTQPYEVILINKESGWNKTIHFVLRRENRGVAGEIDHFVP